MILSQGEHNDQQAEQAAGRVLSDDLTSSVAASSDKVVIRVGDTPRTLREMAEAGGLSLVDTDHLLADAARAWYTATNRLMDFERNLQASSIVSAAEAAQKQFETQLSIFPSTIEQVRLAAQLSGYPSAEMQRTLANLNKTLEQASKAANAVLAWQPPVQAMDIFDPVVPLAARRRPPAQPAAPEWREALEAALKEGRVSTQEVIKLVQRQPEQKPAEPEKWAMIETVVAIYKERGHRYENQASFLVHLASKGIAISVPTFQRWLKEWEKTTGERVRPGRGCRKQRSI